MMYTNEFANEITKDYGKKEKDLPKAAEMFAKMIRGDKRKYFYFGPYWWAVKKLIKEKTDYKEWFTGDYFDDDTYWRAWHGTELKTISAANHYLQEQLAKTNAHSVIVDGQDVSYTLYDEDAGF